MFSGEFISKNKRSNSTIPKGGNYVKKLVNAFSKMAAMLSNVSGIMILIMSIAVCVHVILRAVFNTGIQGIYEFVQYAMMTVVCLTLAENELTGGNVIVNFILDKMRPRVANIVEIVMYFITIIFMCVAVYYQILTAIQKFNTGGITGVLKIPHWILMAIVCIGLIFFVFAFIIRVYNMITNHKSIDDRKLSDDERAAAMEVHSEF